MWTRAANGNVRMFGAIISGGQGTATSKIAKLRECGVTVSDSPAKLGVAMKAAYDKFYS